MRLVVESRTVEFQFTTHFNPTLFPKKMRGPKFQKIGVPTWAVFLLQTRAGLFW